MNDSATYMHVDECPLLHLMQFAKDREHPFDVSLAEQAARLAPHGRGKLGQLTAGPHWCLSLASVLLLWSWTVRLIETRP